MEQPQAAEGHCDAVLVAGVNDLLVADGAAGLHDGGHAGAAGTLDVVAEGEEGIRAKAHAGHFAQIFLLFLSGQRGGLLGKGLGPHIVANHILGRIADVNINGVVTVGLCHIVAEGQVEHLTHVAQLPVVGLLACQTGAVDAALLACAHADGLAVVGVAHAVGLSILQGDECNDQITLLLFGHVLVLGDPVVQHGVGVDDQLVAALLKGDAVHLLVLDGSGLVGRVDGDHVVVALFLAGQDSQCLRLVARGDDAVGHLVLDQPCGGHIADVRKGDPVAKGGHAVRTACTGIGICQRRQLHIRGNVVHFAFHIGQGQPQRCACRGNVLEGSCCGQTTGSFQLLDQLDGVERVQKIDVAGLAVQHSDRQVRAIFHINAAGLLVGVAAVLQCQFVHWCILLISLLF